MRLEKEQDLLRHLKEDACLPVYLLYGQQSYLVRLYAKKLREKFPNAAIIICADNDHKHRR